MKYLINYADLGFIESQKLNSSSGLSHGFDKVISYKKNSIDADFRKNNREILNSRRGAGYWLWKPYIILKTLNEVNENDIVFYSDSGVEFIKDMTPIFSKIKTVDRGVLIFRISGDHKESTWCRRNVAEQIVNCDKNIVESPQYCASFIGMRNCKESKNIISEWLSLCVQPLLIKDLPRQKKEFKNFRQHRHDQAILSLLAKKLKLETHIDISQWGGIHNTTTEDDIYVRHHRRRT